MSDVPQDAPQGKLASTVLLINRDTPTHFTILMNSNIFYADCPGTQSSDAGKVAACSGCPNQAVCASGLPRAPDPGEMCT